MKKEISKLAKKNLRKIRDFQIVATVFGSISIILFVISLRFYQPTKFWINFPTLILMITLAIQYVSSFGFKSMREANLDRDDEELEDEIARLFIDRTEGLELRENLDMEDRLELLELERIKERVKLRDEDR